MDGGTELLVEKIEDPQYQSGFSCLGNVFQMCF